VLEDFTMRRSAIGLIVILALAFGILAAQPPGKVFRIGLLSLSSPSDSGRDEIRQGLRELGYVEGQNIVIEYRSAEGSVDRLDALATDLVQGNMDVIMATGTGPTRAAQQATSTIPVIMMIGGDPVALGFVASLARPGGNITGLSILAPELVGKRVELLKQVVPGASRIAALWHPGDYGDGVENEMLREADTAARALGMQLQAVQARRAEDFDRAFSDMSKGRADAVTVQSTNIFFIERRRLAILAAKHRLPTMFLVRDFVDAGGLMSYGANVADLHRRAATYVDKILKGAKPGDLPVEQPTKFELVINLKTAKTIGLTIPPSVLARSDQVIE
jgi:putative tryptophan/tyrosine transport system substrate-binding protein